MADLAALQQTLGISFNDPSLLEQALVHSSYVNEKPDIDAASNERLDFLGDAVLGLQTARAFRALRSLRSRTDTAHVRCEG